MNHKENNIAFIDWQNLHLWTHSENWMVDFKRFRIYLKDKYNVNEVYYFLWFLSTDQQELYTKLQKSGFILIFKEHSSELIGNKKWNVDVDIVFEIMKKTINEKDFDKIILVSWDGDYIKLVKYLIEKWLFKKILFPNKKHSSLYNKIKYNYWCNLWVKNIRNKIEYKKRKKCP